MEVEARVKVNNLEEIKKKLTDLGAEFFAEKTQIDSIFKPKGFELRPQGPGDIILRVRESDKNYLTFKAFTEQPGVWVEHETVIENPKEAKQILLKSGFVKALSMTKKRLPGKLNNFEICLDDIKELGTYIEISLDSYNGNTAKKEIMNLLDKLEFDESQIIHKGYVTILLERLGIKFKGTG